MLRPLVILIAFASVAAFPSAASADATCSLVFDVEIDGAGVQQSGPGRAQCLGTIAGQTLDDAPGEAWMRATMQPGTCGLSLEAGSLRMHLRRIFDFTGDSVVAEGDWTTFGSSLSGLLSTGRVQMDIAGAAQLTPANADCTRGRLNIELRTSAERPVPVVAPAPATASAPAPKAKAKPRKRACRKARGKARSRAAKRCRRTRRA
jgi:hypothetical protein